MRLFEYMRNVVKRNEQRGFAMENENYIVRLSKLSGRVKILIGYHYYPGCDLGTWEQQYTLPTIGM